MAAAHLIIVPASRRIGDIVVTRPRLSCCAGKLRNDLPNERLRVILSEARIESGNFGPSSGLILTNRPEAPFVRSKLPLSAIAVAALLFIRVAAAPAHQDRPSGGHEMSSMGGMDIEHDASGEQGMNAATQTMSSHHMEMGRHLKITELRSLLPGDQEKANRVVQEARQVMQKYQDYRAALNDGFQIFLPNVPQQQYHFTNYRYGFEAAFHFNPDHPTSLLYDKTPSGYKLAGVMYTAPARASEDELNQRIPLSIAQCHQHVNFCFPAKEQKAGMWQKNPKFGMAGSISTQEACDQAGGKFVPRVFGWMVHLYPNEKDVWAMGPGMKHEH